MANEIYNSSWWGNGVCDNSIDWGVVYKDYAGCTPSFNNTFSLAFDGIDDYVDCGNISDLNGVTTATWSIWAKKADTSDDYLMSCYSATGSLQQYLFHQYSDKLYIYLANSSGTLRLMNRVDYTFNVDEWYHIAIIYNEAEANNSDKVKVYINGNLEVNQTAGFALTSLRSTTASTNIGKAGGFTSKEFGGNIDEVAIFNSVVDIADLWNGTGEATDLSSISGLSNWYRNGDNGTWKSPQWLIPNNENKTKFSNYSFSYDGVNDYINTGTNSLIGASTLTISAWFKSSDVDWQYLLGDNSIRINIKQSNGDTRISFTGSVDPFRGFGVPYSVGNWNNIILTFDGSLVQADRLKLYHNGVEINNINAGTPNTTLLLNTAANFMIGRAGSTLSNPWNGNIDEVAYWDSVEDVSTIYNSGTPNDISSLSPVGYWRSEQSNFTDNWLVDNSALSNYSTRSFNFDGISDYINTGTNSLIGASTLTISAWFKSSDVDWQYLLGDNSIRINIKQSNGDTRISFTGSVDPFRGFGVPYSVGNWNNIILTFDGSLVQADRLKLYHNGVEINNINAGTPNTTLLLNTAANFMIGRAGSTLSNPWNGNIDEVAYWDSVEDASTIYNSGTPARIEGAVSHWKMGEDATFNTNWILPDNGSASNTGTSANMTIADLEGNAPNYTGGGLSNNMTIEDRVGDASNSTSNAVSFNMDEVDRESDTPS